MPTHDKIVKVTASPKLAAIGVAILSGLTSTLLAKIIIVITTVPIFIYFFRNSMQKIKYSYSKHNFRIQPILKMFEMFEILYLRLPNRKLAKLAVQTLLVTNIRISS